MSLAIETRTGAANHHRARFLSSCEYGGIDAVRLSDFSTYVSVGQAPYAMLPPPRLTR
jgi:hypothetical protein